MSSTGSTIGDVVITKKKKKEKYLVFDEEGLHEYTITKKEKGNGRYKYVMKRSKGEQWNYHVRGEKLFTIIDDDMDIKIFSHDCELGNMVYHQLIELGILIDFVNNQSYSPSKHKIVKVCK